MRDSAGEDRCVTVDPGPGPEAGPDDTTLAAILREVRARTGTDFAGYRASTVRRRIMNRVISARAATLEGYLSRLRADPAEAGELLLEEVRLAQEARPAALPDIARIEGDTVYYDCDALSGLAEGCEDTEKQHQDEEHRPKDGARQRPQ